MGNIVKMVIEANIDRFKAMLKTEIDPTKRAITARLLSEEEAKLTQMAQSEKRKPSGSLHCALVRTYSVGSTAQVAMSLSE